MSGSEPVHAIVTLVDLVRVGGSLRALRIRGRMRQQDLAERAHVSRGDIGAIELGRADRVTLAAMQRVADALGARLDLAVRWNGERLDRLLDEAHAATVAATVARLERDGWVVAIEATFSIWGERGSIDVLAWHASTQTVLVIEVKSVVPDIQSLLQNLDRKVRLAAEVVEGRGWHARTVGRLVVVAESPTSRGCVRRPCSGPGCSVAGPRSCGSFVASCAIRPPRRVAVLVQCRPRRHYGPDLATRASSSSVTASGDGC